jgi:membrane associated rhomboid family serine protease
MTSLTSARLRRLAGQSRRTQGVCPCSSVRAGRDAGSQNDACPPPGAVYLLLLLFIGSWIGQFFAQLTEFTSEQQQHGQSFAWSDFLPAFFSSTLENWQSEWLQLIFQAIILLGAKHLLFKVDAEDLERIENKIDELRAAQGIGRD